MAKTIPQLTDATTVNAADELIIQQGGITKRATRNELMTFAPTGASQARLIDDRFTDVVSVKDFGALGNATAEAAAIAAAKTAEGYLIDNTFAYTLTVGSTGDFATINDALRQADKMRPAFKANAGRVQIKLLAGFVMAEQVMLRGKDFSFVTITGDDASTNIDAAALTAVFSSGEGATSQAAFNYDGCFGPVIGQLFDMNSSGTGGQKHGLYCENGAVGHILRGGGFINCGDVGAYAKSGSTITARGCLFTGCLIGVFSFCNSHIDAAETDCSNAAWYGVYVNRASTANFHLGTATNCQRDAFRIVRSSAANAELANLSGATGVNGENGAGILAQTSIVHALSANVSGCAGTGVLAIQSSTVDFALGNANNCGGLASKGFASLHSFQGSTINAGGATAQNGTGLTAAVLCERGSAINFTNGNCSGSTAPFGAVAVGASNIAASGANCRKGANNSSSDISVLGGAIISAPSTTGGTNVTINTINANGIIFG